MLPDVAAIEREFDYLVPDALTADVRVGTLVRIPLHGRRVGGWVVADDVEAAPGLKLREIARVTGWGPTPDLVDLARWAAWRWAGRPSSLLRTASPVRAVRGLPSPASAFRTVAPVAVDGVDVAFDKGLTVLRLPPAEDHFAVVSAAVARGPALVIVPSVAEASNIAGRLVRQGTPVALVPRDWPAARAGGYTVVGSRAAAFAPAPDATSIVVLDGHDEALKEERTPTWHARDVAVERARRAGVACVITSPCPDLETLEVALLVEPSRRAERDGWAALEILDRRREDPRTGLYSERLVTWLRGDRRVVCVLNRKGRARLLACAACGELARCGRCSSAAVEGDDGLQCRRCGDRRTRICDECGATRLRVLRPGVTRVREELAALTDEAVGEITGDAQDVPQARVLVGTEAVLHRVSSADMVAFLDFDQELLAPRYRAAEQALALLARASRLVRGRRGGGRVLVQTRLPDHEVLVAALHGDPGRLATVEAPRRVALRFPPASALAAVSGAAAAAYVAQLQGVEVIGPDSDRWLVRAEDHTSLCTALAAVPRPAGRLRIEVDPLRI